ncbi:LAQU0S14e02696g1_1 [Lachancea quebecensis]|uniref:ER membrane protein complex subunit 4 n=1 Tax=Lachancea quebecensis TaxID=1654605 RepID=A0A0P1KVQ4_9SACH|nr:LAQU0S14e02696g1_1 [Lachancea quebecensis]
MPDVIPEWARNLCDSGFAKKLPVANIKSLPLPPGFKSLSGPSSKDTKAALASSQQQDVATLMVQKAWQIAFQPAKSIPMNMIMSYMSGTSLQIISIMTALMFVSNPVKSIANMRNTFKPVMGNAEAQPQVVVAMVMFVFFQVILMGIGVHKLNSMGLIPNTRSDWLLLEQPATYKGKSYAF